MPRPLLHVAVPIVMAVLVATGVRSQTPTRLPSEPLAKTQPEAPRPPLPGRSSTRLPLPGSWAYQLQNADLEAIAASPFDLVVIDYSRTADDAGRYTAGEIARLQKKPDGSRRIVLAYLSIGEAESYRSYWRDHWVEPMTVIPGTVTNEPAGRTGRAKASQQRPATGRPRVLNIPTLTAPPWLGLENPQWPANYLVRYWDQAWQDIIFGSKEAELDRIVASGFDGVYLDRVDAYLAATKRPGARDEMIRFVLALAQHARTARPAFLIVPQNAEELLESPDYIAAIDGIAKEDLFYGQARTDEDPNPEDQVRQALDHLDDARRRGLPVLVIEYVRAPAKQAAIRPRILEHGFVPYFSVRALDQLVIYSESQVQPAAKDKAAPPDKGKRPAVPGNTKR